MLEHIDAVKNVDAILAVPGIDATFIGPYDLSASMGLPGQIDHPDVIAAQETIRLACQRHGVPAGIHVVPTDREEVQRRVGTRFPVRRLWPRYGIPAIRNAANDGREQVAMSETVLVTRTEFEKAQAIFAACEDPRVIAAGDDETSLSQAVRDHDCRAVIVGVEPYSGPLYEALAETRGQTDAIIIRFGVGHDSVGQDAGPRSRHRCGQHSRRSQ